MTHAASLPKPEQGRSTAHAQGAGNARGLAAMLLAVVVATVGVLAEPLLAHWSDAQLFAGWLALWAVALIGTLALTGSAVLVGQRLQVRLEPAEARV